MQRTLFAQTSSIGATVLAKRLGPSTNHSWWDDHSPGMSPADGNAAGRLCRDGVPARRRCKEATHGPVCLPSRQAGRQAGQIEVKVKLDLPPGVELLGYERSGDGHGFEVKFPLPDRQPV